MHLCCQSMKPINWWPFFLSSLPTLRLFCTRLSTLVLHYWVYFCSACRVCLLACLPACLPACLICVVVMFNSDRMAAASFPRIARYTQVNAAKILLAVHVRWLVLQLLE